jgi:hypothetical protein
MLFYWRGKGGNKAEILQPTSSVETSIQVGNFQ